MIWQTAEERIISDGSFMLPVPRSTPAIVFISQGTTAPPKKICIYAIACASTLPRPPSNSRSEGPKISMPSMKTSPKQMPISSACAARVEARSISPAPSARAIADATPPPIAPPDMVMVRITQGNSNAIAASDSTPRRPI
jgi:hypothetical protein